MAGEYLPGNVRERIQELLPPLLDVAARLSRALGRA